VQTLDVLFHVSVDTKDYDTAKSTAEAIVAAQPKSALGYLYEGMLAEEAKHNEEALRLYGQAAELQPNVGEPIQAQTRLLVAMKRIPDAFRRLDDLSVKAPTVAWAPLVKGDLLMSQKDFAGAQASYKIAVERAPKWWQAYRGVAAAQFAARDPDGALATLRAAQPKVDDPAQLGIQIGTYDEFMGKPQDAIREYEDVVRSAPQSEVAANNLAMLLVTYDKDAASLERAKSLTARFANSSNPTYLDTYGWVLYKHGEAAASVPVLQRVVSRSPDAPVLLYHLGMAQSQSGSTAQAVDNLTRAVNSGLKFAGLDEARATLSKLAKPPPESVPKS
jgi:tetratricopeptide (TPR) repeat protein